MSVQEPPTQQPIITDQSGITSLAWLLFFNQLFNGDAGDDWTPIIQGITYTGGVPSFTGRVYKLSQYLAFFAAQIIPANGGSVSGNAGAYRILNFPLALQRDGACLAVSGNVGVVAGMCVKDGNLIYPPSLLNVTQPITIVGIVEAGNG